jgi:hypothetical protein
MKPRIPLRKALADPLLLGGISSDDSWKPWRSLLIASMGEALLDDERALFKELTGREREPGVPVEEFIGVIGRRRLVRAPCTGCWRARHPVDHRPRPEAGRHLPGIHHGEFRGVAYCGN